MLYASRSDLERIYGVDFIEQLAPPDDRAGVSAVERALEDVGATIESYLSVRYQLPLAAVPISLRNVAVDMACYRLAITHDRLTDELRQRYEDSIKWLKDIAAGRAGLGLAEPQAQGPSPVAGLNSQTTHEGASFSARPRLFRSTGMGE